jgi:hypothetical protein
MIRKLFLAVVVIGSAWTFFWIGLQEPRPRPQATPSSSETDDRLSGGERAAGLQQAKLVLTELKLVPTTANWPWEMIDTVEGPKGQFVVTGTVEVDGYVREWSSVVVEDGDNLRGVSVTMNSQEVWSIQDN